MATPNPASSSAAASKTGVERILDAADALSMAKASKNRTYTVPLECRSEESARAQPNKASVQCRLRRRQREKELVERNRTLQGQVTHFKRAYDSLYRDHEGLRRQKHHEKMTMKSEIHTLELRTQRQAFLADLEVQRRVNQETKDLRAENRALEAANLIKAQRIADLERDVADLNAAITLSKLHKE